MSELNFTLPKRLAVIVLTFAWLIAGLLPLDAQALDPFAHGGQPATSHSSAISLPPALKLLSDYRCDEAIGLAVPFLIAAARKKDQQSKQRLAQILVFIGRAFQFDTNDEAALQAYCLSRALAPDYLLAIEYQIEAQDNLGYTTENIPLYSYMTPLAASHPEAARAKAREAFTTFNWQGTINYLQTAIKLEPDNPMIHAVLASILKNSGFFKRAEVEYEYAGKNDLSPYNREYFAAQVCALASDDNATLEHEIKAGAILPAEPSWHTKVGIIMVNRGDPKGALTRFKEALNCPRLSPFSFLVLAEYFSYIDRTADGLPILDRYDRLYPRSASSHAVRGAIYAKLKDEKRAEQEYKKGIEIDPNNFLANNRLCGFYWQHKNYQQLVEQAQRCASIMPGWFRSWRRLGDGLSAQGYTVEACKAYRHALDVIPGPFDELNKGMQSETANINANLGATYYQLNCLPEAIEQAIEFNKHKFVPEQPKYLSWMRLRPDRLDFDQPAANSSVGQAVRHAALADMLYEANRKDQSCTEYRKAIALEPRNAEWNMCLFSTLVDKGDYGEAMKEDIILANKLVVKVPAAIEDLKKGMTAKVR